MPWNAREQHRWDNEVLPLLKTKFPALAERVEEAVDTINDALKSLDAIEKRLVDLETKEDQEKPKSKPKAKGK